MAMSASWGRNHFGIVAIAGPFRSKTSALKFILEYVYLGAFKKLDFRASVGGIPTTDTI